MVVVDSVVLPHASLLMCNLKATKYTILYNCGHKIWTGDHHSLFVWQFYRLQNLLCNVFVRKIFICQTWVVVFPQNQLMIWEGGGIYCLGASLASGFHLIVMLSEKFMLSSPVQVLSDVWDA